MKKIKYIYLLLGIFFSCQPSNKLIQNDIENNTRLLQDLMELWETGDTSKTPELFVEKATYTDVPNNNTMRGIEGINQYLTHVHMWASNVQMDIRNIKVSPKMGYVEWTFTAVHTSPIPGRVSVATNRNVTLKGATLVEFNEGKIQKASDYMDVLGFVIPLGSKVELPGGVIIGNE
ncbi:nuclear transport factor 2 family protein [Gramella sp. KN1008]|uniref:nuclear transport factor 2 family protein n=1 Tax=Gramella sp. KN1008 TaxID=2529298 RepID=UPI0010391F64|nr:nuclear transport factor 2 family protein [Gramella sp. KN1008]TBW29982.1 nuclear transport factor 2 family protein [Gramella sp. KN1008]